MSFVFNILGDVFRLVIRIRECNLSVVAELFVCDGLIVCQYEAVVCVVGKIVYVVKLVRYRFDVEQRKFLTIDTIVESPLAFVIAQPEGDEPAVVL